MWLLKGVGLVENRNTKCIFGGVMGWGVGGWGGGRANNVQVHLHTYWMLSLLAHTNILPATIETFSPALTHILLFTLETSSLAHHTYFLLC